MIEALLFLYDQSVESLVGAPTSPCDAALRAKKKAKADLVGAQEALIAEVADLETQLQKAQDEHKPRGLSLPLFSLLQVFCSLSQTP